MSLKNPRRVAWDLPTSQLKWSLLPEEIRFEEKAKPFKSKIKEWIVTNIPD